MGFWNYIGLASKKDIENINTQMDEIKKIINIGIKSNGDIKKNNNHLQQSMSDEFTSIENNINTMNAQLKEIIEDVNNNNISRNEKLIQKLNESNIQNLKSNDEAKKQIADLGNSLNPIYLEITEMKKYNDEKFTDNDKSLKQFIKEFKEYKKNVDSLNKDLSIIQQMIRMVWVNDIVDTLESKLPSEK
ncbi:hypothetical protein [Clostridium sp. JNZ J1-5]